MAKQRISSVDLGWIILGHLKGDKSCPKGLSLAVIPDLSDGWRVIVDPKNRKRMRTSLQQRLAVLEKKLHDIYTLID